MEKKTSYKDVYKDHRAPQRSMTLDDHPKVEGYDFEKPFELDRFIQSMATTGFQATNVARAIDIIRAMRREKATIFLSFTSNMISSGVREAITYLVKHKLVDVIITTAGGIEEDVIKTLKPFAIGDFEISGKYLFDNGVNRTGNLLVPNDRYTEFEKFMTPFLEDIHKQGAMTTTDMIRKLGAKMTDETSYLHWATKNDIPVFCPGILDGAFGDMIYFAKQRYPDFSLDITGDMKKVVNLALQAEKTGGILLGGGIAKHFALNANIFHEGFDYAIYINTGQEYDGSDSGARLDEAVTWGKVKPHAPKVKVHADATIIFPLIVTAAFPGKDL
jgi:deoxyhypusine synthase